MDKSRFSSDWIPDYIGNYQIVELVGMGGMGVIYKAIQQGLDRTVALKVLQPQHGQDNESSARFETEARAISMLNHQNIVQIYEYGKTKDVHFFAMQFVDGENLAQRIARHDVMPLAEIMDFSKQICRGLRYAHSMNIIHRDIKPQNVLIDKNNIARLTDFGIAKIVSQSSITMTGVTVGTPEYMSPEQAEGQELTKQTDIYSLGILIFEMLTKQPPFSANNPIAVAYKQVHELPLPPSSKRKDTPKRLELIVLKTLKKRTEERYQSIEEMLNDLDSVNLDEKVNRTTVMLRTVKENKAAPEARGYVEKRIVDRRSGDRRYGSTDSGGPYTIFCREYWIDLLYHDWLIIALIAILYLLFFWHLGAQG